MLQILLIKYSTKSYLNIFCSKDDESFWRAWRKRYCSSSVKPVNTMNGKQGDTEVCDEFTRQFQSVFTTSTAHTHTHTHTHTHPFNGPLSGTTLVSRYQKGKTNLDFTGARDSEWQWQQLGNMQICTSLQSPDR